MPQELLTADQIAARLQVKGKTVRRWATEGRIPAIRLVGQRLRFDWDAVLRAIRTRDSNSKVNPT